MNKAKRLKARITAGHRTATRKVEMPGGELAEDQLEGVSGGSAIPTDQIALNYGKVDLAYQHNQTDYEFIRKKASRDG